MVKYMKNYLFNTIFLTSLVVLSPSFAFGSTGDFLRSTGKIYSVVAVLLILFIAIVLYLVRLEKKIALLEKLQKSKNE
jgi:hypothetical protein